MGVKRRRSIAVAAFCAAFLAIAATASATGGIDRSFGRDGLINLKPQITGYDFQDVLEMETGPRGGIYLLEAGADCPLGLCSTDVYLTRRHADGSRDRKFANGRGAVLVAPESNGAAIAVDSRGRVVIAYVDYFQTLSLARLNANGRFDRSFSGDGKVSISCDCREIDLGIKIDARERVVFVARRTESSGQHIIAARVTAEGRLDRSFGKGGWRSMTLAETGIPLRVLVRGNSILLAGALACCDSAEGIYLRRIGPRGWVDYRFARRSRAALRGLRLPAALRPHHVGAILPRAHGKIDVLGSTEADGFVLRFRRDGHIDKRFAGDGLRHVAWLIRNAAKARGGRVFAFGHERGEPVSAFGLLPSGRIDRSFGGGDPILLEDWSPFSVTLAMQWGRRPLLFDPGIEACRSYCPNRPKLMRFTALGPPAS